MADAFKRYLNSNIDGDASTLVSGFQSLLDTTTVTSLVSSKILRLIFEAAESKLDDSQKALLKNVESLVSTLQTSCLQPKPRVRDTLFFPNPASETKLISYLDQAKTEMLVCVFTITNNNLRDAVLRAHQRGVSVRVISDDECMKQQGSDVQYLRDFGIPTETDTNPEAHMHNKFVVIDKAVIVTGSFNWTVAAVNSNQENLVVLHEPEICSAYIEYFDGLWKNFRPVEVERDRAAVRIQSAYRGSRERGKNRNN
jgi:mitochondrial cardiolipin hydrolase